MDEDCKLGQHEYVPWEGKWECALCGKELPTEEQAYGTDCRNGACEP